MIAPRNSETALHVLTVGLSPDEFRYTKQLAENNGGTLETVQTDMELWGRARGSHFDVYVLGQSEENPSLAYLVWLLKGIAHFSSIVLIYSSISAEEAERLRRCPSVHVLQRPLDGSQMTTALDDALNQKEDNPGRFWPTLTGLFHRHSKTTVS